MLINITVNKNGEIGIWLDQPIRKDKVWKGKFPYINSICYKQVKKIVKETQMDWFSDYLSIPI
jgi:hypothetical protein